MIAEEVNTADGNQFISTTTSLKVYLNLGFCLVFIEFSACETC